MFFLLPYWVLFLWRLSVTVYYYRQHSRIVKGANGNVSRRYVTPFGFLPRTAVFFRGVVSAYDRVLCYPVHFFRRGFNLHVAIGRGIGLFFCFLGRLSLVGRFRKRGRKGRYGRSAWRRRMTVATFPGHTDPALRAKETG